MLDTRGSTELVARESYGRLLAWLVSRSGDIAAAEDALGDALLTALSSWPVNGIPRNKEAWLLTVARRRLIDNHRRHLTRIDTAEELKYQAQLQLHKEAAEAAAVPFRTSLPDRRLDLLFMCAHPKIPEAMRTPLMLQTVLGLTAEQIAALMLLPPSTVSKRLVRLKKAIVGEIPFEATDAEHYTERLSFVLDAVYAAYGSSWEGEATGLEGRQQQSLASEAFWLAGLLVRLIPDSAEALGLYALLCFCESRRGAQRTPSGAYVPLEDQDCRLWDLRLIKEGESALKKAATLQVPGTYQIESAIHSIHAHRTQTGQTDWNAICFAYEVLIRQFPSIGAAIGYAASLGRLGQTQKGLQILDELNHQPLQHHQPYWAVRAWLLARDGQTEPSKDAYNQAIDLCKNRAVREWLHKQQAKLP